jgi:flagellar motor switch protein FliM
MRAPVTIVDPGRRRSEPRPFDFRRPNKLNRDHLRNLEIVFETFARQFSTVLSSSLRVVSHVELQGIEQRTYDEYVTDGPNPTHLVVLALPPLPGPAVMQFPPAVAFTMVELLLGGHGSGVAPKRQLTEIEVSLVDTLVHRALDELTYAFESVIRISPSITQHESNPQFAQIVAPSDMTVVVSLAVKLEAVTGTATLCLPYTTLQPVLESFSGHLSHQALSPEETRQIGAVVEAGLREVPVSLSLELPPVKLTPSAILALALGDVINFGLPATDPIVGSVSGLPMFRIRPARRGKRLAGQIVGMIQPPKEER